jgi:hypothetical protein
MIGLDIDGRVIVVHGRRYRTADVKMLAAKYNSQYVFPEADVEVRITRHGYHVVAFGPCLPFEQEIKVRAMLGDDRRRVHLDEYKKSIDSHNYNVLWTEKAGFRVHEIEPV